MVLLVILSQIFNYGYQLLDTHSVITPTLDLI